MLFVMYLGYDLDSYCMKPRFPLQKRFPALISYPELDRWLTMQAQLQLAPTTLDSYARAILQYFEFCQQNSIDRLTASNEHIALYVNHLATKTIQSRGGNSRHGLANATMHQYLTAIRLYYDHLQQTNSRQDNPVKRGVYTAGQRFGGNQRGLIPRYSKLPWIPNEEQWIALIRAACSESLRNRLMFALAYDGALRREELCSLQTGDIDPSHRIISIRAEYTKTKRGRTVPYFSSTNQLYAAYLKERSIISRERGPLFLSESHRNKARPLTIWTWSKVIRALALRAGVPNFTTHSFRHLRLTDLARAGWELHEISTFAGHQNINTTLTYIHLSGRDLASKLSNSMDAIHAWRVETMNSLLR